MEETILTTEIVRTKDAYEVRLPHFEGPLDLLLHLIKKEQIDIYDIPIARITERYLEYLQRMQDENINLAGEFLEMAATLIFIKSRALLPPDPAQNGELAAEEDPMRELMDKLIELDTFKNAAQSLYARDQTESVQWNVSRLREVIPDDEELVSVSLYDLMLAFKGVLQKYEDRITVEMEREEVTVAETIRHLEDLMRSRRVLKFSQFLQHRVTRLQLVVLFIAVLELARMKLIRLKQDELFSEILIIRKQAVPWTLVS